ncbi:MAG: hypothetical protein JJT85_08055 [Chromatiales bacterium]|nr:hypothetical protein [Chromatiales bacterium]
MATTELRIDPRFRGPPQSGNGGYVCGRLASLLKGPATARLHRPPPLGRLLHVEIRDDRVLLLDADELVAEARPGAAPPAVPAPPAAADARNAAGHFAGFNDHPFPGCFVCGPQREPGDGLRIFAGPLGDRCAAPWQPDESLAGPGGHVDPAFLWAALDCPGAWSLLPLPPGRAVVLGELSGEVDGRIRPGDSCVVQGWPLGRDGRRWFAGSSVHDARGQVLARARATWIEVPLAEWGGD